jgi:3-(3-hydroxy-phenyl)propionate hydroxylase
MAMTERTVVIAGAGPTGLMLGGELALAGVDAVIVERRLDQTLDGSRAGGLHARTIEVLDQRGIADRFVSQGQKHPALMFHMIPLAIGDAPTRHNYVLALWQSHIERILAAWVDELGVPILRGREVTGFVQDDISVDVALSDGESIRARYLVGCDGGRSVVRKAAGIDFPGWDPTTSWLIAEVETSEEPVWGMRHDALGTHGIARVEEDGRVRARIVLTEPHPRPTSERTVHDLREQLVALYGTDFGIHHPSWISSFTDMSRQAAAYRAGRVLLAGDAAHVHPPIGSCLRDRSIPR